ncbi:hypothetical protein MNBD_GAMMA02-1195 [hydrothermal vent metagenome]|uniref:Uncharacterized protein n=1 Tax=hydrothermal vent metagenome TaxID=652676 RepID=A0A3B0VQ31_9ZZZZ
MQSSALILKIAESQRYLVFIRASLINSTNVMINNNTIMIGIPENGGPGGISSTGGTRGLSGSGGFDDGGNGGDGADGVAQEIFNN